MNKSPQYNQPAAKQCDSEAEEIGIHQNWPLQHLYKMNSGFHARKNPSEATISKVVKLGSYMKQKTSK